MKKHSAPLFERLIEHAEARHASFHVPGHKSGHGLEEEARPYYESLLRLDMTEISGLDDLHHPEEAILEAQRLAADCFGAEETFFLVNGSTVGNLAMILSVCRKGEILLVQRDVHKSVIHALMLAEACAVFLKPEVDPATGLTLGLRAETVRTALRQYPGAKGLLVTRPGYYGNATPLEPIAQVLHNHKKLLLVDEAHGAHLGFHPSLPASALSCGADAVVQSTHKMLTAMTMGAMFHIQGELIDRQEVRRYLTMLQSSSPSYPLMASLDLSRRQMHTMGKEKLAQGLEAVKRFKSGIAQLDCFEVPEPEVAAGVKVHDPFKIVIRHQGEGEDGFKLKAALESRGCFVELADPQGVLLVFSLASTKEDADRLLAALKDIAGSAEDEVCRQEAKPPIGVSSFSTFVLPEISEPVSFDESVYRGRGTVHLPLDQAVGRRAAEMIVPYPPGIPVFCPGERITEEGVRYLTQHAAMGARIHGLVQEDIPLLPVIEAGTEQ